MGGPFGAQIVHEKFSMTAAPDEEVMKKLIAVDGVVFNSGLWAPASLQTLLDDYQSAVAESTKATLTSYAVAELKNRPDAVFHNDYPTRTPSKSRETKHENN